MTNQDVIQNEVVREVNKTAIEFLAEKHGLTIEETCEAIRNLESAKKQYMKLMEEGLRIVFNKGMLNGLIG